MKPRSKAIWLMMDAFEALSDERAEYGNEGILNEPPIDRTMGIEVLRHAIMHLVFPAWERDWPSAVPEE